MTPELEHAVQLVGRADGAPVVLEVVVSGVGVLEGRHVGLGEDPGRGGAPVVEVADPAGRLLVCFCQESVQLCLVLSWSRWQVSLGWGWMDVVTYRPGGDEGLGLPGLLGHDLALED